MRHSGSHGWYGMGRGARRLLVSSPAALGGVGACHVHADRIIRSRRTLIRGRGSSLPHVFIGLLLPLYVQLAAWLSRSGKEVYLHDAGTDQAALTGPSSMLGQGPYSTSANSGRPRVGVVITSYGRPDSLLRVLKALEASTLKPERVVIVDNSETASLTDPASAVDLGLLYMHRPDNIGVPAAIGLGMTVCANLDLILTLDDDTVVSADTVRTMAEALTQDTGAVSVPTAGSRRCNRGRSSIRCLPWSPSLFRTDAVKVAGLPRSDLFFKFDDWEYANRLRKSGYLIRWTDASLTQQKGEQDDRAQAWRGYFGARNSVYLLSRWILWDREIFRAVFRYCLYVLLRWDGPGRNKRRLIAWGLMDGLRGRMGPPRNGVL